MYAKNSVLGINGVEDWGKLITALPFDNLSAEDQGLLVEHCMLQVVKLKKSNDYWPEIWMKHGFPNYVTPSVIKLAAYSGFIPNPFPVPLPDLGGLIAKAKIINTRHTLIQPNAEIKASDVKQWKVDAMQTKGTHHDEIAYATFINRLAHNIFG